MFTTGLIEVDPTCTGCSHTAAHPAETARSVLRFQRHLCRGRDAGLDTVEESLAWAAQAGEELTGG